MYSVETSFYSACTKSQYIDAKPCVKQTFDPARRDILVRQMRAGMLESRQRNGDVHDYRKPNCFAFCDHQSRSSRVSAPMIVATVILYMYVVKYNFAYCPTVRGALPLYTLNWEDARLLRQEGTSQLAMGSVANVGRRRTSKEITRIRDISQQCHNHYANGSCFEVNL